MLTVPRALPEAVPAGPVVFKRIVCAVDFSDCSLAALRYALSLAQEADGQLTVVHVLTSQLVPDAVLADQHLSVLAYQRQREDEAQRRLDEAVPATAAAYCRDRIDDRPRQAVARNRWHRHGAAERSDCARRAWPWRGRPHVLRLDRSPGGSPRRLSGADTAAQLRKGGLLTRSRVTRGQALGGTLTFGERASPSDRQDRTGGAAHDLVGGRTEEHQVERIAAMHPHDNRIGAVVSRGVQNFNIRLPLHNAGRRPAAIGGVIRQQCPQLFNRPLPVLAAEFRHVEVPGRNQRLANALEHVQDRQIGVSRLGDRQREVNRVLEQLEKSTGHSTSWNGNFDVA